MGVDVVRHRGAYGTYGYNAVRTASRDNRISPSGSGDEHLATDRRQLVHQARDFQRNNGIFTGMIDRASSYVVGNGFGLQAKTEDSDWNVRAEALWTQFWERPEVRGIHSGPGLEQLLCSEIMTVGEVGVVKTNKRLLQIVEAEQLVSRNYREEGIRKDKFGRPTKFFVSPYGRGGKPDPARAREYAPEEFLFITRPDRPSSTRSVPPLQPSFSMLHRINDVCDSEAIAWQLLARLAISINRENSGLDGEQISKADPDLVGADTDGYAATRITEVDYALIFHAKPGETIKGVDRNIPGRDFGTSLNTFLRLLGVPLGLPLEIIILDWTKSNYSQSRAVLLQAYVTFQRWQGLLESFFHKPVYRWFVDLMIDAGKLEEKDEVERYRHEWIKPTFPWIDQLKEAQAYGEKLDRGFCTHGQVVKTLGHDRKEVMDTRVLEIKDAIERAKKIEEETGVAVPWQPFAGLEAESSAPAPAEAPPSGKASQDPEEDEGSKREDETPEEREEREEREQREQEEARRRRTARAPRKPIRTHTQVTGRDAEGRVELVDQSYEYAPQWHIQVEQSRPGEAPAAAAPETPAEEPHPEERTHTRTEVLARDSQNRVTKVRQIHTLRGDEAKTAPIGADRTEES